MVQSCRYKKVPAWRALSHSPRRDILVRACCPSVIDYRVKLACLLANILNDISKFCILFFANYFANITKRKQNQAFPPIISTKIINDGTQMYTDGTDDNQKKTSRTRGELVGTKKNVFCVAWSSICIVRRILL